MLNYSPMSRYRTERVGTLVYQNYHSRTQKILDADGFGVLARSCRS